MEGLCFQLLKKKNQEVIWVHPIRVLPYTMPLVMITMALLHMIRERTHGRYQTANERAQSTYDRSKGSVYLWLVDKLESLEGWTLKKWKLRL